MLYSSRPDQRSLSTEFGLLPSKVWPSDQLWLPGGRCCRLQWARGARGWREEQEQHRRAV
jgi:hypothetical protein